MARILRQHLSDNGVLAEVLLTREETLDLGGVMEDVTVFTDQKARTPARISLRGRKEATKYFLIPRVLRRQLNTLGSVSCQRIKREGKDIFVYVVDTDSQRRSFLPEEPA